ncbi:unnamed protein product [Lasius platythorax]|uniref:C2H2-type domain-containing protein n=1 Tax=Lasius platythorax TaxID=488582 RepID=A0AAV2NKU0_9HYME
MNMNLTKLRYTDSVYTFFSDYGKYNKFSNKQYRGKYICDACGKEYLWKTSLKRHKREECGKERRFICALCGKRFKHKHHLKDHQQHLHNL